MSTVKTPNALIKQGATRLSKVLRLLQKNQTVMGEDTTIVDALIKQSDDIVEKVDHCENPDYYSGVLAALTDTANAAVDSHTKQFKIAD